MITLREFQLKRIPEISLVRETVFRMASKPELEFDITKSDPAKMLKKRDSLCNTKTYLIFFGIDKTFQ